MISLTSRREGRMGNQIIVYFVCFLLSFTEIQGENKYSKLSFQGEHNIMGIVRLFIDMNIDAIFEHNQRGKCINDDDVPQLFNATELNSEYLDHIGGLFGIHPENC